MKVFTYQYQNYTHLFETAEVAYNEYLRACGINKIEDHFKIKSHCSSFQKKTFTRIDNLKSCCTV